MPLCKKLMFSVGCELSSVLRTFRDFRAVPVGWKGSVMIYSFLVILSEWSAVAHLRLICPWGPTAAYGVHAALMVKSAEVPPFPCTHPSTPSTRLDRLQSIFSRLRYDATGNRTQPTRFGGAFSTSGTTKTVQKACWCKPVLPFYRWSTWIERGCTGNAFKKQKNANSTPQFCFISDQFRSVPSLYPKSLRPLLIAIEKVSGSGCTNALYNRQAVSTCQTLLRQEKPLCVLALTKPNHLFATDRVVLALFIEAFFYSHCESSFSPIWPTRSRRLTLTEIMVNASEILYWKTVNFYCQQALNSADDKTRLRQQRNANGETAPWSPGWGVVRAVWIAGFGNRPGKP